jgi:hypothetical protein
MPPYRQVPVDDLFVPDEYQRPLDEAWVGRITDGFRSELFHPITVSDRNNGKKAVVAGQHRLMVAKNRNDKTIGAFIHTGLTPEEEAELFVLEQKGVKAPTRLDLFRARVASGPDIDPDAYNIARIVESHGFQLGRFKEPKDLGARNNINAVGALERLYRQGVLARTLYTVNQVWRGADGLVDHRATAGELLRGVGIVVDGYEKRVTPERLEKLADHAPRDILRRSQARARNLTNPHERAEAVVDELRSIMSLRGRPNKTNRPRG